MTLKIAFPTLIAFCFYGFTPTLAQAAEKVRTIAVSGTATTKVAPDMVVVVCYQRQPRICLRPKRKATNKYRQF